MVAVLFGAVYFMRDIIASKPEPQKRPVFQTVFTVEAVEAEVKDHQPLFSVFGSVTAARDVDLRALSPGEIAQVSPSLSAGNRVEKGDLLARIDAFEYEGALAEANANVAEARAKLIEKDARIAGAEAQIESTERQLQIAREDLQRAEDLRARGTLTEKDGENRRIALTERELSLTQRLSNIEVERAGIAQLEAQLERLEWRVTQAERNLQNTRLVAPFSGIVQSSAAEIGKNAGASDVLVSLYDDTAMEARFTLSDAQFGRLIASDEGLVGRPVKAVWSVGGRDYEFDGQIARAGAQIASERGGVEVFASLESETDGLALRPGAFVEIQVPDQVFRQSLSLPETTLFDGDHVYVLQDGKLIRREVDVRAYDGDNAIVTGDIATGERVLNTRLAQISEGTKVRTADEPEPTRGEGRPRNTAEQSGDQSGDRAGNGERPRGERQRGGENRSEGRPNRRSSDDDDASADEEG
jgi:RND family efflux transporter MFP subunit